MLLFLVVPPTATRDFTLKMLQDQMQGLYVCKGYLFSSSSPIDTVISSSNGIRLALPGVLAHDIPIRHWLRNHRLLQQAVKQHPV